MLPEIGEAGQARLLARRITLRGDPQAVASATAYLARAGVGTDGGDVVDVAAVRAGRPELEAAAAFLGGAWTAVETIKATLAVGEPAPAPALPLTGPEDES
jgi:hypothetical protein